MTQKELKKILSYNPDTGILKWKVTNSNRAPKGAVAGYEVCGYTVIQINKKLYLAHRLAWLYVHGEFPKNDTDHINQNRSDNRIVNLRSVTRIENCKNRSMNKNNTSGIGGVSWDKVRKKWLVHIAVNNKVKFLGRFKNINEAKRIREQAKIKYGYHPNHA